MRGPAGEEGSRAICRGCGELVSPTARTCPHCSRSVTVDLRVRTPIEGPRERYPEAWTLAGNGPPSPSFLDGQRPLTERGSVLLRGLTRAEALDHEALLTAARIDCDVFAGALADATGPVSSDP